jgi:prepilin-type N-terminal cleavage/methylation domain-containing protein
MSARPRRRASGFTIVELVAVIAIVGILAALAAPLFLGSSPLAERGYADELASALRVARSVAVATSCDAEFSLNTGAYQVRQRAASGGGSATPCLTAGAYVTPVRRTDGNTLSGTAPADVNVPINATFAFSGGSGSISGGVAPPPLTVGAFTVSVSADGWVQVQ